MVWPDSEQTQELLQTARAGDESAVNALMNRHRDALRQMVQMRLDKAIAARLDASDVVQDVLLEANRRLQEYLAHPVMPFHLWLRQLAQDQVIDMHRRHRVARRRSVDREQALNVQFADQSSMDLAARLKDHELTPAAATIRKELERRFHAALDELDDDDREIMLMRHQEHLTNSEVAAALGLTQAAAGMRYLRAVRRLREVLGGDHPSLM